MKLEQNLIQEAIQRFYDHLKGANLLSEQNLRTSEDILNIHLGYATRVNYAGVTVENVRFLVLNLIFKLKDVLAQELQYHDGLGISDRDCILVLEKSNIDRDLSITELVELLRSTQEISLIEDRLLWNRIGDYINLDTKDMLFFEYREEAELRKIFAPYAEPLKDGRKIIVLDSTDDLPLRIYCEPILKTN